MGDATGSVASVRRRLDLRHGRVEVGLRVRDARDGLDLADSDAADLRLAPDAVLPGPVLPVSYTHLDVYKRQSQDVLLRNLERVPDSLRLGAATDYGRTLRLLGKPEACVTRLGPLEELARGEQRQLPVQAADFYSEFGRCQRVQGRTKVARLLFQRSLEVRRNTLDDIPGVVENLADLADLDSDAGNTCLLYTSRCV